MARIIIAQEEPEVEQGQAGGGIPDDDPLKVPPMSSWNQVDVAVHDIPTPEDLLEDMPQQTGYREDERYKDLPIKEKVWAAINKVRENLPLWIRYIDEDGVVTERVLTGFNSPDAKVDWARTTQRMYLTAYDTLYPNAPGWKNFLFERILDAKILKR